MKDIIATQRKKLGYTQEQLAEKLNVSDKVVSKWETGRSLPDTSILTDLAEALEISVNELLNSGKDSKIQVKNALERETQIKYKNLFAITIALQLIVAILMSVFRMALEELRQNGDETVAYLILLFSIILELATVTFFTVTRNNLLNKCPKCHATDKAIINRLLLCTYLLLLTVIFVFVMFHGLEIVEQLIVAMIWSSISAIPFVILYLINRNR